MGNNIKLDAEFVKHPTQEGVFMKHFFSKSETNDRLNNLEVNIVPNFQIAPHTHDNASEYFYVVEGCGEFLDNTEWIPIKKGDAFQAPMGMTHAIKNTGRTTLVLFSTFSPPIK
jgi:mannose-6-phosphate isomerase-like protein (cupin superfamily)